ncbi:MAG: glycosyltransferase, partial [bacterium]|nr:glycosyltransferase [bacterium]
MRGNDWRSLPVAPVEFFEPDMVVTVVIPYFEAPEALARTLAGLEGQTYPRELFEVVVVDDGSDPPLELDQPTPLRVRVIHQDD